MAFLMNYTNGKGANYPESYWRLGWLQLDRSAKIGNVRFDCYFNSAAREADAQGNVLECKHYTITEANYDDVFESASDPREACYDFAQTFADDFFAAATNV